MREETNDIHSSNDRLFYKGASTILLVVIFKKPTISHATGATGVRLSSLTNHNATVFHQRGWGRMLFKMWGYNNRSVACE